MIIFVQNLYILNVLRGTVRVGEMNGRSVVAVAGWWVIFVILKWVQPHVWLRISKRFSWK